MIPAIPDSSGLEQSRAAPASALAKQVMPAAAAQRCIALDTLRGFVMLALAWGLLAREGLLNTPGLHWLGVQLHHVKWEGLAFWDLIQPGFWFAVGASMPFALARRRERGFTFGQNLRHALTRALKLMICGQILIDIQLGRRMFHPRETLTQIAVCYLICFLILHLKLPWQVVAAAALMALNTGLYVAFPGSSGPFAPADNVGVRIDRVVWSMNPVGMWVSIYCIGSSVSMLFGCWAGGLLLSGKSNPQKLKRLIPAAAGCLATGLALAPFDPVMQKLWTASYTFATTGIVLSAVLVLFWLFDLKGRHKAAFPLVVVGTNGIFFYLLSSALGEWTRKSVGVFTSGFRLAGPTATVVQATAAMAVFWYICYWLHQRKIFLKL